MSVSEQSVRSADGSAPLALFVSAFFDELHRAGVRDVVVSPGSRSTPLSMVADASDMNVYLDVDERGAAFFALGLAKASARPVAVICTSGTAVANWYPAVMEANTSRVPLIFCSGDRPPRLQQLGAPQTCDQLKAFGCEVKGFWNMPVPSADERAIAHARQIAREACIACAPDPFSCGPVHINFPFDEPLKPDLSVEGLFVMGRAQGSDALPAVMRAERAVTEDDALRLARYLSGRRVIVLAGENTLTPGADEEERGQEVACLAAFARCFDAPLIADPLSGLRAFDDEAIVECGDAVFAQEDRPGFDAVVRFGRYPVSKKIYVALEREQHVQIVVDPVSTRDFNAATTTFVSATPAAFVSALLDAASLPEVELPMEGGNLARWREANLAARTRAARVAQARDDGFEGAYVRALVDALPQKTVLFTANSMSVRALDTFLPTGVDVRVLANRGLNGIDGTTSSALGAAQTAGQTVYLAGDLTMLHDLNAFALQGEFKLREAQGHPASAVVAVLLNNQGGAIFDMLPQASDEPYFERLFLTPHQTDFSAVARAFDVPFARVDTLDGFDRAFEGFLGKPGIHLIEVQVPLRGVRQRYAAYQ